MRTVLYNLSEMRKADPDDQMPAEQSVGAVRSGTVPVYTGRRTGNLRDAGREYHARIP